MSWKQLVVFADASADGDARLKMAGELAAKTGAYLDAHIMAQAPQAPYGIGAAALADAYAQALGASHKAGAAQLSQVRRAMEGVARFEAHQHDVVLSDVRSAAGILARAADLVVAGRPETQDKSAIDTRVLMGALFEGARPCVVLPRWEKPHLWGRRVVIAWKGTPEATRALNYAIPVLQNADLVRILVAAPRGDAFGEGEAAVERLRTLLSRHGVKCDAPSFRPSWDDAERVIESEMEIFGADCLVMGAYGHARLGELILGGVTSYMLNNATVPIFMAH